ncbi:FHA domain-containing protein [Luteimonas yindakuii]|uniref:FHA domain-containing protein n=1 Tax=Luteimonas yindakuii TaxID=2565782 RepID=A0A4Z1RN18_9GAMM|nr:FHA domain-containing protein [Luteimonas yindakuii]TKS55081.1 FHA domain-containing protein [Luteimonas yindakuii]
MTHASHPDQAPAAEGKVLRIVAGLHAGASRALAEREMILVGSGDDCDIVLADRGVAIRHALISVIDGAVQLRALDAPLKLEGRLLHPGDPEELPSVQRVGLGEAALAFGDIDDPAWLALAPEGVEFESPSPRPGQAITRRLPMIAAVSVLSLALLAIFVAVVPAREQPVDIETRLRALAAEHHVANARIERGHGDSWVLSGTIGDRTTRDTLRQQVESEGLPARVDLRSGEDLAYSVSEILRGGGFSIERVRYLGNDDVEVSGYFTDEEAFRQFAQSRAVVETGVNRVVPINLATPQPSTAEVPVDEQDPIHIVSIVRGENAHVIALDGTRYEVGAQLPGWGQLVAVGEHAQVLRSDGNLQRLTPRPPPPAPSPADATEATPAAVADASATRPSAADPRVRAAGARQ